MKIQRGILLASAALCVLALAGGTAAAADLWGTQQQTGRIFHFDTTTGVATLVGGTTDVVPSPNASNPNGNARDGDNDRIYFASFQLQSTLVGLPSDLYFRDSGGTNQFAGTLSGTAPDGVVWDGDYYYVDHATDDLRRVDLDGGGFVVSDTKVADMTGNAKLFGFGDIAFNVDGVVYGSATIRNPANGSVTGLEFFSYDPVSGAYAVIAAGPAWQIAFADDGLLWGHETATGSFYTIDLGTGATSFQFDTSITLTDLAGAPPPPVTCDADPHTQGYWHRQCLGLPEDEGGIDPGRNGNGRGPGEPNDPDFKTHMPTVTDLLGSTIMEYDGACQGGMDATPPSDSCERAIKQYTALLFNQVSGRVQDGCGVDLGDLGCGSDNFGDLVDEVAALINSGMCKEAADCAGAVNEGTAIVERATVTEAPAAQPEAASTPAEPTTAITDSGTRNSVPDTAVIEVDAVADLPSESSHPVFVAPQLPAEPAESVETIEPEAAASEDDVSVFVRKHLAVLSSHAAPEAALEISRQELLTILSGGYSLALRLEIVEALVPRVDAGLHALLSAHLLQIQAEAKDFEQDGLARRADRLIQQLDSSLE